MLVVVFVAPCFQRRRGATLYNEPPYVTFTVITTRIAPVFPDQSQRGLEFQNVFSKLVLLFEDEVNPAERPTAAEAEAAEGENESGFRV